LVVAVSFQTTTDDKDRKDPVIIRVLRAGAEVASCQVCQNTRFDDPSTVGPFGLWFPAAYDSRELALQVEKPGTDGWHFNVIAEGIDQHGGRRELLRQNGLRLRDQTQSTGAMNLSA
jgi:hypothetical protein